MLARAKLTRVENAYEQLKADILQGALPPGYQAPEPDIADRLQMSRTPVREALIRLESEGLIKLIPRRGALVIGLSLQDLIEVFEILSVLEPLAASTAAQEWLDGEWDVRMTDLVQRGKVALQRSNLDAWVDLDDQFHRLVAEGGSRRLSCSIGACLDQVHRAVRVLVRLNKGPVGRPEGNAEIAEAISSGDPEAAAGLARQSRLDGMSAISVLFKQSGLAYL